MDRSSLTELHYITSISNVPSVLQHGILSHRRASAVPHESVAMLEIQEMRGRRAVPGGRPLHDYVNLYLCARNPMLFRLKESHQCLCVLRISMDVLDLAAVVISDGNAASGYTAFWPSPAGLARLDHRLVFAEYWTDDDQQAGWRKKRVKCAEVLVPDVIAPQWILGAYVSCAEAERALCQLQPGLDVIVDRHLFFV